MAYWTEDRRVARVLDRKASRIVREHPVQERQSVINAAADKFAAAMVADPSMADVDEAQVANELRTELRKRIN